MGLLQLKESLENKLWQTRIDELPYFKRIGYSILRVLYLIVRDILDGQLNLRAMSLVYTTILSMVPLIAVSFSVLKGFGVHNQLEPALLNLLEPLGPKSQEITLKIIEFVENMRVGVLGSLGLALLLYTVISLVQKIESSFNYTWHVTEPRPLAQRFSDYLSVILIGPVLIFSALGITATVSSNEIIQGLMQLEPLGELIRLLGKLVPFLLVAGAFTFVYVFIPNTKVKLKSALYGALTSAFLWQTAGWVFATVVAGSSRYTAIYSAFATIIMFMIWLYVSWLILLIGASIAFYHQHPEHRTIQRGNLRLSNRYREKMALIMASMITQRYYRNEEALSTQDLAETLELPMDVVSLALMHMENAGILVRTDTVPPRFIPGRPPETLELKTLLDEIRKSGESTQLDAENIPSQQGVERVLAEIDQALDARLDGQTLKTLALGHDVSDPGTQNKADAD